MRSRNIKMNWRNGPVFGGLLAVLALTGGRTAFSAESAVSGRASFEGERPAPTEVKMIEASIATTRVSECQKLHSDTVIADDIVIAEDGGLANVFVYIKDGLGDQEFEIPEEPAKLDQLGCIFIPHVSGVRAGQKVGFANSDPLVHNSRSYAKKSSPFNIGQVAHSERFKTFRKPEMGVKIRCDIHIWMNAWIHVMDHPFFATTDAEGNFSIEGLPAGEYTLAAWHEVYGEQEQTITVDESGSAKADFTFAPAE